MENLEYKVCLGCGRSLEVTKDNWRKMSQYYRASTDEIVFNWNNVCKECDTGVYVKKPKVNIIDDGHRYCKRCGEAKNNESYFYRNSTTTGEIHYDNVCKKCKKEVAIENRLKKRVVYDEQECIRCNEIRSIDSFEESVLYVTGVKQICLVCRESATTNQKQRRKAVSWYKQQHQDMVVGREEELLLVPYWLRGIYLEKSPVSGKQVCKECGELLDFSEFTKSSKSVTGLSSRCRACTSIKRRAKWVENREHNIAKKKEYYYDEENNTRLRIRSRIKLAIDAQRTNKKLKSLQLLGCTGKFAHDYLVNMGYNPETDEIDHIVPCAAFDLSKKDHQLICFNYRNLQPLHSTTNRSKSDSLPENWFEIVCAIGIHLQMDVNHVVRHIDKNYM